MMTMSSPTTVPWLKRGSVGRAAFEDSPKELPTLKHLLKRRSASDPAPNRRIATRGTEVFVAAGCEVRCLDLRDLKARSEEEAEGKENKMVNEKGKYQILDLPELDFEAYQLEISPDGNLLALVGEKRLSVCVLPTPGFARLRELPRLRSKYKEVGPVYHNEGAATIVRALWHPFGVEGASLVVATSDGFIRMYDFTMHLEHTFIQPDQTYDLLSLSGTERRSSSFTPDLGNLEPASCCFGSGDSGWRPFTLYILTRGGDLYALCPIVPSRWIASTQYVKSLGLDITARVDVLGRTDSATMHEKFTLRQQTKWVNELLEQQSDITSIGERYSYSGRRRQDWFIRPESVGPTPCLQGPFLLQPGPVETTEEYYGCDIMHISSDEIAVLVAVYANYVVDIFVEPEPITAKWIAKKPRARQLERESELPVVASLETINLQTTQNKSPATADWPILVESPLLSETFYVVGNNGVYAVDMADWMQSLKKVLDQDETEDFIAKCLERSKGSKITKVIDPGKSVVPRPMVGCAAVQDSYLGYIIIANSHGRLHTADLDIPLHCSRGLNHNICEFNGLNTNVIQRRLVASPGYVPSILQPYYDPPEFLSQRPSIEYFFRDQLNRNPQLMRETLRHNAQTLEILRQGRDQIKKEYEKLMAIAEAICKRAKMQEIEYKRQLAKADELVGKFRKMKDSRLRERLDTAIRRQQELNKKADQLIRELVMRGIASGGGYGAGMAKLSEKEKAWFGEVQKVEDRVTGEQKDSFKKRIETVNDMMIQIQQHLDEEADAERIRESEDREDGVPKELRERRMQQLNQLLDKEGVLIEKTKSKTVKLEVKLDALRL